MSALHEFLLARLDDDQRLWRLAFDAGLAFRVDNPDMFDAVPNRGFSERMLADVEAKRRVVEQAAEATLDRGARISEFSTSREEDAELWATDPGEAILRALAAVYADHPDYRDEWKPDR